MADAGSAVDDAAGMPQQLRVFHERLVAFVRLRTTRNQVNAIKVMLSVLCLLQRRNCIVLIIYIYGLRPTATAFRPECVHWLRPARCGMHNCADGVCSLLLPQYITIFQNRHRRSSPQLMMHIIAKQRTQVERGGAEFRASQGRCLMHTSTTSGEHCNRVMSPELCRAAPACLRMKLGLCMW